MLRPNYESEFNYTSARGRAKPTPNQYVDGGDARRSELSRALALFPTNRARDHTTAEDAASRVRSHRGERRRGRNTTVRGGGKVFPQIVSVSGSASGGSLMSINQLFV